MCQGLSWYLHQSQAVQIEYLVAAKTVAHGNGGGLNQVSHHSDRNRALINKDMIIQQIPYMAVFEGQ